MRAAKVCSEPRCPELVPCPTHQKIPWEGSTRRSELPPDWEKRRRSVIARADHICEECKDALGKDVHHVGDKMDHSLDNLQLLCGLCHRAITQQQATAARRT